MSTSTSNVATLEAARDKAREDVANAPEQQEAIKRRTRAVELKEQLKRGDLAGADRSKAIAELADLTKVRDAADAKRFAPLTEAQKKLSLARKFDRDQARAAAADKLLSDPAMTEEALTEKRLELMKKRRALKEEQTAVTMALTAKHTEKQLTEMVDGLSPLDRKRLAEKLGKA